ncbi:MAG: hypothetical protein GXO10_05280 [Crenarchaeota archaeon]|nr:hypothetical protein [Thermoproteota archaeon]
MQRIYLQARFVLSGGTFITILVTLLLSAWRIPLFFLLIILSVVTIYLIYTVQELCNARNILRILYTIYLDPPMDDRILILGTFTTLGVLILVLIILYLLHYIPLV